MIYPPLLQNLTGVKSHIIAKLRQPLQVCTCTSLAKDMNRMEYSDEDLEPVSPTGQYLNSSALCIHILGVLEFEVPIDDSQTLFLLRDVFLPINPRFSSIMLQDKNGEKRWKPVDVKLQEHVKIPFFPEGLTPRSYEKYFDDYVSRIAMESLPLRKPLWQIHIIKYPTSNAAGTVIFKLHHALGDGYSLMGALLSCLQRADNPSLPLTFPSKQITKPKLHSESILRRLVSLFPSVLYTIPDFGWSVLKSAFIEDDQTPIRSADEDVNTRPVAISTVSFSLQHIKEIGTKLGVTINDVITGIIFYGIRLYMKSCDDKSRKAHSTALVLLNTRNIRGYTSVEDMVKTDTQAPWGNRFAFLHISIPKLSDTSLTDPLTFVWTARKIINRKKGSLAVSLTGILLEEVKRFRGSEAAARYIHSTLKNSSVTITNIIGPLEKMSLANHPVKGLYYMVVGPPESLTMTVMSYMGQLRVGFGVEKDFINLQKFKSYLEDAFDSIHKAACDFSTENMTIQKILI